MTNEPTAVNVRARTPWLGLVLVALIVLPTLANATLNLIPMHIPTKAEMQREEQAQWSADRRAHLAELLAQGDQCRPAVAHDLARTLVFDGRSARAYADDYERRCGSDPVVRRWATAPLPRPRTIEGLIVRIANAPR